MSVLIMLVLVFCLHLLLKLNWIITGIMALYLLGALHFHRRYIGAFRHQIRRFEDASLYMDTMLYAFMKEAKIFQAFENTVNTLEEGELKRAVEAALDYMRLTFDDAKVLEEGMAKVYDLYPCGRIATIHQFMLHVEYYGGQIKQSIELLAEDKNRWSRRINQTIAERSKMFKEVALSVAVSIIICGVILYLPVMNVDISTSWIVQVLSLVVVIADDLIILRAQSCLCVDYLTIDELDDESYYAKKMKEYEGYDEKKARRTSWLLSIIPLAGVIAGIYLDSELCIAIALVILLVFSNQHRIGRRLARKSLTAHIKSAFPKWLLDMALLLQSENVYMSLVKSKDHVPQVLADSLDRLIGRIEVDPESSEPYHHFLEDFRLPEIHSAVALLYGISAGSSANAGKQMGELISRNLALLDISDSARLRAKAGNMYILFLAPVLTASMKLVVDMAVFLLSFLSMSVV